LTFLELTDPSVKESMDALLRQMGQQEAQKRLEAEEEKKRLFEQRRAQLAQKPPAAKRPPAKKAAPKKAKKAAQDRPEGELPQELG
jgi:hypothetical protein